MTLTARDPTSRSQAGFALVLVVISLAALSMLLGGVLTSMRRRGRIAEARLQHLQLEAATNAGLETAIHRLSGNHRQLTFHPETFAFHGITVQIAIRPEASKLDLQTAGLDLLALDFKRAGFTETTMERLVQLIKQRRHRNSHTDLTRGHRDASTPAFQSLADFRTLAQLNYRQFSCLASDLTVFEPDVPLDLRHASPRLQKVAVHAQHNPGRDSRAIIGNRIVAGEIFDVTLHAWTTPRTGLSRTFILRVTGNPRDPVWMLTRYTPALGTANTDHTCTHPMLP